MNRILINMDGVKVCIPTLNESNSIGKVVNDVRQQGYEVVVIDGGSIDGTKSIASKEGAEVMNQEYEGQKGAAVIESIEKIDSKVIVFIDGDNTYDAEDIEKIHRPVTESDYDHVIGNRFYDMKENAMSVHHKIGNKIINAFFFLVFRENLKDILSGFRAIRTSEFDDMKSKGFGIESEMTALSVLRNHKISVVGTSYYPRDGQTKLNGLTDGIRIVYRILECRLRYLSSL